jgi:hypothetical protein
MQLLAQKRAAASASAERQPSFKTVRSTGHFSIAVSERCGSGVSLCGRTSLTSTPPSPKIAVFLVCDRANKEGRYFRLLPIVKIAGYAIFTVESSR